MNSIRHTNLYSEVIKELNYPFGDIFIFEGYVVSEIKEDIVFSWEEHALPMVEDVSCYLGSYGDELIYISHRIHSYSVKAIDWLKFFRNSYSLKGYSIVEYKKRQLKFNFENLFFNSKIKRFTSIESAVEWAKESKLELAVV